MPRERNWTNFLDNRTSRTTSACSQPAVTTNVGSLLPYQCSVVYGENIKGWKQLIREGKNATTDMTAYITNIDQEIGSVIAEYDCYWPSSSYVERVTGNLSILAPVPYSSVTGIALSTADNRARVAYLQEARKVISQFKGTTFLGELKDTIRMVRNPAKSARKTLQQFISDVRKHRKTVKASQLAGAVADTWLEYAFGLKPLFQDIDDALKAFDRMSELDFTKPVKGIGTEIVTSSTSGSSGFVPLLWSYRNEKETMGKVKFYGKVDYEPASRMRANQELLGFDPEEFLPTAWEVLPWSFLIDYFTNIGDLISAYSYGTSGIKWTSRTAIQSVKQTLTDFKPSTVIDHVPILHYVAPKCVVETMKIVRAQYTGDLMPRFELEFPDLTSTKWLNIAALVTSRNVNKHRPFGV